MLSGAKLPHDELSELGSTGQICKILVPMAGTGEVIVGKSPLFGPASARAALGMEAETYVARAGEMMNRARAIVQDNRVQAIASLKRSGFGSVTTFRAIKYSSIIRYSTRLLNTPLRRAKSWQER